MLAKRKFFSELISHLFKPPFFFKKNYPNWLVDVHLKFKLLPETLFLTVNLIDRDLNQVPVSRQKLQLVGVDAMLIASKYEEIYPPDVKEFEYVTDKAYNKAEILDMEGRILSCLNFNLTTPSSLKKYIDQLSPHLESSNL